MEILISASIFGIALVIAVGLFTSVSTAQRRVQVMSKLQGDTRYLMEVLAQEIRINGIDYSWYTNGRENGTYQIFSENPEHQFDILYFGGGAENSVADYDVQELVTKDSSGMRRVYRLFEIRQDSGQYAIAVCTQDTRSTDLNETNKCHWMSYVSDYTLKSSDGTVLNPNFKQVTPDNISVDEFHLWIRPGADPNTPPPSSIMDCRFETVSDSLIDSETGEQTPGFEASNGMCTCFTDSDCRAQECVGVMYMDDEHEPFEWQFGVCTNPNEQPRATIIMTSRNVNVPEDQQQTTTLQTTVSTRTYKR